MFSLFILGYVEDTEKGVSFRMYGGMQWNVYIEVGQYQNYKFYY